MGSSIRSTAAQRITPKGSLSGYVERIAEEAEQAADAADMVRVKAARHGKATRRSVKGGGNR